MAKRKRPKAKADSAPSGVPERSDSSSKSLSELRRELDRADAEILKAINRRGEIVQQIGGAKRAENSPAFDPVREGDI